MKFVELKKRLENKIDSVYLISGADRFLCYKSLEMIEKKAGVQLKDMNSVTLSAETLSSREIIESANVFPFGDEYRLVVVKNFNPKPSTGVKKNTNEVELENYLKQPMQSTILVFFNPSGDEFFKNLKDNLTHIDCDKLELNSAESIIASEFMKQGISLESHGAKTLALMCNLDMTKIYSEIGKLISFALEKKNITTSEIKDLVVEDKEYQIFELSEYLANGKKFEAFEMIQSLQVSGKSGFSILTPLYNNYRRVLFTAINSDKKDSEIAIALGVKEYAIKMCRNQARVFTPKKLKKIVDMLAEADKNIKMGKIKEDTAVKTIIISIMKLREGK